MHVSSLSEAIPPGLWVKHRVSLSDENNIAKAVCPWLLLAGSITFFYRLVLTLAIVIDNNISMRIRIRFATNRPVNIIHALEHA